MVQFILDTSRALVIGTPFVVIAALGARVFIDRVMLPWVAGLQGQHEGQLRIHTEQL
jgi:hypothetical protein